MEVPRRRRPIAVAVDDDAVGSRRFLGFSAVGSRLDVALRRELGGDAGVVLERRVVGQHGSDVVAVAPRVVPHSQSLAARAVRVFPRRVSKAVEHVRLDEEGIVARDVCRVAVAVRVAQRLHAPRVLRRVQVLLLVRAHVLRFAVSSVVIRVRVVVQAVVLGEEIVEPVHGAHVLRVRLVVDVVVAVDDAVGGDGRRRERESERG